MANIKREQEENIPDEIRASKTYTEEETKKGGETLRTELELRKYVGQINHNLKKNISDEFKHAKLDEKERKHVMEMTDNAYKIIRLYKYRQTHAKKWDWNPEKEQWEQRHLNKGEIEKIEQLGQAAFEGIMIKIIMLCTLKINVPDNDLVKMLLHPESASTEQKTEQIILEQADKIRDRKKKKEDEEDKS